MMRVMVIIKANEASEAGILPDEKFLGEMTKFNEDLVKAGVMLAGEGLHPTSKARRVTFQGGKTKVTDGPFTEAKEMIAGFWLWQVKSMDEAVEWVKRIPSPADAGPDDVGVIDIRPVFETDDFGAEMTPELRQKEDALRAQVEARAQR
jgi:hypothetical protein